MPISRPTKKATGMDMQLRVMYSTALKAGFSPARKARGARLANPVSVLQIRAENSEAKEPIIVKGR